MSFLAEDGFVAESLFPATIAPNMPGSTGGRDAPSFSNTTFNYDTLSKENWSTVGGIFFVCLLMGFIISIILTTFFRLSFTANLCIIIIITSIMMIIIGDSFIKNAGVFILAGVIMTMILTLFIFFMNDIIRGPGGGDLGDTADID